MRILVTGAAGFIGSSLIVEAKELGYEVIGIWHTTLPTKHNMIELQEPCYVHCDLTNQEQVTHLAERIGTIDAIVHSAAKIEASNDIEQISPVIQSNLVCLANVVELMKLTNCRRLVFTSSIAVYENLIAPRGGSFESETSPRSLYGWSKKSAEDLLSIITETHAMTAVSLRLAGVHGGQRKSGALYHFAKAALSNQPIRVAEPNSRFQWAWIEDVVQGIMLALRSDLPDGHHIMNLASADSFELAHLAARLKKMTRSTSEVILVDSSTCRNETLNLDRIQAQLGFQPTDITTFLQTYVHSIKRQCP